MTHSPYSDLGRRQMAEWQSRRYDATFAYVLRAGGDGPIKVGYATNVDARIDGLQTGNGYRLHLLYVVPGDRALERLLHRKLGKFGAKRMVGEWFEPGAAVDKFLEYVDWLAGSMLSEPWRWPNPLPHYSDFDPDLKQPRHKRPQPVEVRYVEPSPKMDAEEAEKIREFHRTQKDL